MIVQNYDLLILFGWLEDFFFTLSLSLFCCFLHQQGYVKSYHICFGLLLIALQFIQFFFFQLTWFQIFKYITSLFLSILLLFYFLGIHFFPLFFKNPFPSYFYNRGHGSQVITYPIGPFRWLYRSSHWWVLWSD